MGNKRIKKTNMRYKFTAEYTSFIHPTYKLQGWYQNMTGKDVDELLSDNKETETTKTTNTTRSNNYTISTSSAQQDPRMNEDTSTLAMASVQYIDENDAHADMERELIFFAKH